MSCTAGDCMQLIGMHTTLTKLCTLVSKPQLCERGGRESWPCLSKLDNVAASLGLRRVPIHTLRYQLLVIDLSYSGKFGCKDSLSCSDLTLVGALGESPLPYLRPPPRL